MLHKKDLICARDLAAFWECGLWMQLRHGAYSATCLSHGWLRIYTNSHISLFSTTIVMQSPSLAQKTLFSLCLIQANISALLHSPLVFMPLLYPHLALGRILRSKR